jgi:Xaa-Pro aminopeptidase
MNLLKHLNNATLISSPSNLFYFTSFKNADAKLLYNGEALYFTDARYFEDIKLLNLNIQILDIKDFYNYIEKHKFSCLLIEENLPYFEVKRLSDLNVHTFISINEQIDELRSIKSNNEIENIKAAQAITDKTFIDILGEIREDMTEKELSSILSSLLYKNGAESLAFDNIVAFGKNTSKPHAQPSNTKLKVGMPITLDFGAKLNNYCSDMTRTIFFGQPEDELIKTYNIVLEAQKIALDNIKPGMTGIECDNLARAYFEKHGLGKYFIHSLGHSLGIDIHESPRFSPKCADIMKENMVMSVEPGLYFENNYGIRIEDIIYFDKNAATDLTKSEKNMIIV